MYRHQHCPSRVSRPPRLHSSSWSLRTSRFAPLRVSPNSGPRPPRQHPPFLLRLRLGPPPSYHGRHHPCSPRLRPLASPCNTRASTFPATPARCADIRFPSGDPESPGQHLSLPPPLGAQMFAFLCIGKVSIYPCYPCSVQAFVPRLMGLEYFRLPVPVSPCLALVAAAVSAALGISFAFPLFWIGNTTASHCWILHWTRIGAVRATSAPFALPRTISTSVAMFGWTLGCLVFLAG